MEIWKDCKGYEGKYQVSNLGRVWNVNRQHYLYGSFDRWLELKIEASVNMAKKE